MKPGGVAPEEIALRRTKVLQLRIKGASYSAIAKALGVSVTTVECDLKAEMLPVIQANRELAHANVDFALMQCDDVIKSLASSVAAGDWKAADVVLKALDQRNKLLGLYAPLKIAPTTPEGEALQPQGPDLAALFAGMTDAERETMRGVLERKALPPRVIDVTPEK